MAAEAQAAEHASQGPTAGEYIQHHLQHLRSHEQTNIIDFSVINFDTLFWSIAMGALAVWLLYRAAKRATSGVPGSRSLNGLLRSLGPAAYDPNGDADEEYGK